MKMIKYFKRRKREWVLNIPGYGLAQLKDQIARELEASKKRKSKRLKADS